MYLLCVVIDGQQALVLYKWPARSIYNRAVAAGKPVELRLKAQTQLAIFGKQRVCIICPYIQRVVSTYTRRMLYYRIVGRLLCDGINSSIIVLAAVECGICIGGIHAKLFIFLFKFVLVIERSR